MISEASVWELYCLILSASCFLGAGVSILRDHWRRGGR